ncbi:MAG: hypothetical protein HF312_15645 [Ignavibacteria bacterium]|jgi:PHP family Zn ribbon phosphoesterase|nr:hypothetical protein [Ignavibacteria bacterium]
MGAPKSYPRYSRQEALRLYLGCPDFEIRIRKYGLLAIEDQEYAVWNDAEADIECRRIIESELWKFDIHFIMAHLPANLQTAAMKGVLEHAQKELGVDSNPLIMSVIANLTQFCQDVIAMFGREHFLAPYDGKEGLYIGYFIYRVK